MTRLFATVDSDNRSKQERITCHEEVAYNAYWGSVNDSKLACSVRVVWLRGDDKPTVFITTGKGVNVIS